MMNFKNKPQHRSMFQNKNSKINFSKKPHQIFEKKMVDDQEQPISVWAIPLMLKNQTGIFGLFDGRLISYSIPQDRIIDRLVFADRIYSSPLIAHSHQMIITCSDSGEIAALDINFFDVLWHVRLPKSIHSSPSFHQNNDLLYVGCYDNALYSLEIKSGKIVQRKELELGILEDPYSSPIILNNKVFIGTGNKLVCLTENLELIWTIDLNSFVDSSPAVHQDLDKGIIGTEQGEIVLFSPSSGYIIKNWSTNSRITCSPAISSQGIACIGNNEGKLYGIYLLNNKIIWEVDFESSFEYTALTCSQDDHFIFTLADGTIRCVDALTGKGHWQIFGTAGYHTPPLVTDEGYLLCGSHFGYIAGYQFLNDQQ